jgi:transposase-like protein
MVVNGDDIENAKWLKILEDFATTKKSGKCPYCKNTNTEIGLTVDDEKTKMGHGVIWCNDCKKAFHVSRIKVENDIFIKVIPSNLTYN